MHIESADWQLRMALLRSPSSKLGIDAYVRTPRHARTVEVDPLEVGPGRHMTTSSWGRSRRKRKITTPQLDIATKWRTHLSNLDRNGRASGVYVHLGGE
jgi:hypothetical protein